MNSFYSTKTKGIGGQIKRRYTDFIVEEMLDEYTAKATRFTENGTHMEEKLTLPENSMNQEQLQLDMEKINKDTNFAIRQLARHLQCSKKRVGYAGLKDKRAVTCQRISLFKPNEERLESFGSKGIQLRNARWSNERVELGMLKGNSFTITIRDISLEKEELKETMNECFEEMKKGIANYFGEQRFGGIRKITHLVGKEFLKGRMKEGVMLYLTHSVEGEEDEIRKARQELAKTNDFSEASKTFPTKFRYERSMLHHLCKYPNDFVGAFAKLPKQLRYLFTHAYQSYLFNLVIEERYKQGIGLEKQEGDVLVDGEISAPLFGFETKLSGGKAGEIEKKTLEREGISLEEFYVKKMPELSSKGTRKSIVLKPINMRLLDVKDDEFYPGKKCATIAFELTKGNYATTVLSEIMKA